MTRVISIILTLILACAFSAQAASTRAERKAINAGNEAYRAKRYADALNLYRQALRDNPASLTAEFNAALSQLQIALATDPAKKERRDELMQQARKSFTRVTEHASANPSLASRAFFNLGNMAFNEQNYDEAIEMYKSALRLNPEYKEARKNLRISQLKRGKQDKKDNKQDKKDDKQDKKNNQQQPRQQPQHPQDNKDNNDNNRPQQPQQPQQQPGSMSPQAADRILKHSSDKEKQTLRRSMYGNGTPRQGASRKRW